MSDSTNTTYNKPLKTWIVEDVQVRKVVQFEPPSRSYQKASVSPVHSPATCTTESTDFSTPGSFKNTKFQTMASSPVHHNFPTPRVHSEVIERRAARPSMDLPLRVRPYEGDTERQALFEQERLEASYREAREREKEQEQEEHRRALHEWHAQQAAREAEAAAEAELARKRDRERVVREQIAREAELRMQREKEARELEEAAVARAVEESILSEAARYLKDVEEEERERERMRVEAARDRMMREAEVTALEERLRRRVEGKKGWDGIKTGHGGWPEKVGLGQFGSGLQTMGPRVAEVRAFREDDHKRAPYSSSTAPLKTSYGGHKGWVDQAPEPTWRDYNPSPASSPTLRGSNLSTDSMDMGLWPRGIDIDQIGEAEAQVWRNGREDTRGWRETTTERWETVIRREQGQGGSRHCRQ